MMHPLKLFMISLFYFRVCVYVYAAANINIDKITTNSSLKDGDILLSPGRTFALGFFSPKESNNRYVGIWYYDLPDQTVVWVANRNTPINTSSGILTINKDGGLAIYETNKISNVPVWNVSVHASNDNLAVVAKLLDTGNLVLLRQDDNDEQPIWQSFDYPSNTLLPTMKIGVNYRTGFNWSLTSWRTYNDPAPGNYKYNMDPSGLPQVFSYQGTDRWWREGSWTGKTWTGAPGYTPSYFNHSYVDNENETFGLFEVTDASFKTRVVLTDSGIMQRITWSDQNRQWTSPMGRPYDNCDNYGNCGPNSNCNSYNTNKFECSCLPGFEPKSNQQWYVFSDGNDGCVRKTGVTNCTRGEGFIPIENVKIPDTSTAIVNMSMDLNACRVKCLHDCSCVAYATAQSENHRGCLMWYANLIDMRIFPGKGQNLYLRVDAAELARYNKKSSLRKKLAATLVPSIVAIILVAAYVYWFMEKRNERRKKHLLANNFVESLLDEDKTKLDLPLFDLSIIVKATDNFSLDNKLGEGGFGPVHKGVLPNGITIAIKRLSETSRQGAIEFKNEIALLAKLQHRNLVKIFGYCIDQEEKMLIYEYLANKSLDSFIFDETNRSLLNWSVLSEIIQGIARGISYLHHDSRLRIIHRDLKASNILLDADMIPKVSDFGMARIFGGDQAPTRTNRVVGTYGYMSPEYAMEGRFSIKSDVYSFGILLLEILTGRKNTVYYTDCPSSTLVRHVWGLWEKGEALEIIDSKLKESCSVNEASRCIQIGLLCVQDQPTDRPNMLEVVSMLSTNIPLPNPKQCGFIAIRSSTDGDAITSPDELTVSINEVTVSASMLLGR